MYYIMYVIPAACTTFAPVVGKYPQLVNPENKMAIRNQKLKLNLVITNLMTMIPFLSNISRKCENMMNDTNFHL